VLRNVVGAMGQAGSNNILGRGCPLLALGPEHAATIARDGFSKQQVKEYVFAHARYPLGSLGAEFRRYLVEVRRLPDDPGTLLPIASTADAITVIVVGGAGKHSCWQPTFGDQTRPARRPIARRDGTPIRQVADLRR
jgi:hypothetical protein